MYDPEVFCSAWISVGGSSGKSRDTMPPFESSCMRPLFYLGSYYPTTFSQEALAGENKRDLHRFYYQDAVTENILESIYSRIVWRIAKAQQIVTYRK